jgi:hypothetical protein
MGQRTRSQPLPFELSPGCNDRPGDHRDFRSEAPLAPRRSRRAMFRTHHPFGMSAQQACGAKLGQAKSTPWCPIRFAPMRSPLRASERTLVYDVCGNPRPNPLPRVSTASRTIASTDRAIALDRGHPCGFAITGLQVDSRDHGAYMRGSPNGDGPAKGFVRTASTASRSDTSRRGPALRRTRRIRSQRDAKGGHRPSTQALRPQLDRS